MFLEILGLIFIFVLLAFLPRVVGGIALWYIINAIYWPGEKCKCQILLGC